MRAASTRPRGGVGCRERANSSKASVREPGPPRSRGHRHRRARCLRRRPGRRARRQAAAARGRGRHRRAEGGLAPRRGRCRRQDRRRRRHPCRDPAGLLRRGHSARRPPPRPGRLAVGMVFLPRPISARRSAAADRRDRDPRLRLRDLWLAPGAGQHRLHRREGQRDAAGDRADHDRATPGRAPRTTFERDLYVIRRRIEKQAIAAQITELLHLLAVAAARSSTRACSWRRA